MTAIYDKFSAERKQLQEQGLCPEWYTTGGYQMIKTKYLLDNETPKGMYERLAKTAAKHLPDSEEWEKRFFDVMWKGWLSPATPVLTNMGTNRGTPVSCSGGYVGDSVYDFYECQKEVAVLSQNGFGTSSYLGDIRPRGAEISRGGKASGVLPIIKDFVQVSRDITQGSNRRGAWAGYLEIDHKDFFEVAEYLYNNPDDLNIGWIISDAFIERLDNGDKDAISRYQKMMKIRAVTGKGYHFYKDKVNRQNPPCYKDKGFQVKASQLCVAPETKILTKSGYENIVDLVDEQIEIWNGFEWSTVTVKKTGDNQQLVKVTTNAGFELECTKYHKFYVIKRGSGGATKVVEKQAKDLVKGDKLIKCNFPVIEGDNVLEHAYANGFYSGDGCNTKYGKRVYLYGEKRKLKEELGDIFKNWFVQDDFDREYGHSDLLKDKFFVPCSDYDIDSRIKWFTGLCDADGTVARNGKTQSIQVCSINKEFLLDVQLMLQTIGVSSKVTLMKEAGVNLLPKNDGSGDLGNYETKEAYRLLIGQTGICTLKDLGFETKRLLITNHRPNRECSQFVKVEEVIDEGRISDTYCFTEPKRNLGVFNGICTGQCNEIYLYSDQEYTYTCVLSSMNVSKYDEWKDTDAVFVATVFLDCVAEEFIQFGKNIRGLEKAVKFTEVSRALGLGVLGYATYLQDNMIPFESFEARRFNKSLFKLIKSEAVRASQWMAESLGEPEWCKGYGMRNTHLLAVAPTMSTSLICGGVSQGIEPIVANVYNQNSAGGEIARVNPSLLNLMKNRGIYNKEVMKDIAANFGSVQHVKWLSEEEKEVFKTAYEIDQMAIIKQASDRQQLIDQGQSLNTFFSAEESEEYVSKVHKAAMLDPYIKGMYYQRSLAGVRASTGECTACEA